MFLATEEISHPFTYTPSKAGSVVITASGDLSEWGAAPVVPSLVQTGSVARIKVVPWDANGVLYALPPGTKIRVTAWTWADASPRWVDAVTGPGGLYVATFRIGQQADQVLQFKTELIGPSRYLGGSARAYPAVVNAPPPVVSAEPATQGLVLTIKPAPRVRPIGYAVYAATGQKGVPNVNAAIPLQILDPEPGTGGAVESQWIFNRGSIHVAALYANGALSLLVLAQTK